MDLSHNLTQGGRVWFYTRSWYRQLLGLFRQSFVLGPTAGPKSSITDISISGHTFPKIMVTYVRKQLWFSGWYPWYYAGVIKGSTCGCVQFLPNHVQAETTRRNLETKYCSFVPFMEVVTQISSSFVQSWPVIFPFGVFLALLFQSKLTCSSKGSEIVTENFPKRKSGQLDWIGSIFPWRRFSYCTSWS